MIEALLGDDWMRDGVKIIWRFQNSEYTKYSNGRPSEDVANPDPNVEVPVEPLVIGNDMARALLTALNRHFDGGEDTRSLRKDYDAERKRVDLFIASLTSVQS